MLVHILLVDDDPVQREVRRLVLERIGANILVKEAGEQVLPVLADERISPDVGLLITDHVMPGMNGPELVRRVRATHSELPILVLSGMAEAEEQYEGLDVVFQQKPCHPGELIRLVKRMLGDRLLRSA